LVAGGQSTRTLAWSNDGKTWNSVSNSPFIFSPACWVVAWNGSIWVAGGQGTQNTLAWSSDGKTWSTLNLLGKTIFSEICFALAYRKV
jgi:hypothetical protein